LNDYDTAGAGGEELPYEPAYENLQQQAIALIAPLWRRVAAFLMDAVLLALLGFLIGAAFYDALAALGFKARLVGFVIALLYFGTLNSRIGGGRTIGKRLFGIRVVGTDGNTIGFGRSVLRYLVVAVSWFLNGAPIDSDAFASGSIVQLGIAILGSIAVFGLAAAIVYLVIFNRHTRRSLHDLIAGTYVVADLGGVPQPARLWHAHIIVVVLLLLLSATIPFGIRMLSKAPAFEAMMQVQRAVAKEPGISEVAIQIGTAERGSPDKTEPPQHALSIIARSTRHDEPDHLAQRIANRALDSMAEVAELDLIGVHTYYGYDIGIARKITAYSLVQTPLQWRERIDTDTPEPDTDVQEAKPDADEAKPDAKPESNAETPPPN
jgi:uncharacterized RDD family membrane protein YckC